MQNDIQSFYRSFRQKCKDKGYSLTISKQKDQIILKNQRHWLLTEFLVKKTFLEHYSFKWKGIDKEIISLAIEFWVGFSEVKGIRAIFTPDCLSYDPAFSVLFDIGFEEISKHPYKKTINEIHNNRAHPELVMEVRPHFFKTCQRLMDTFEHIINDFVVLHPTTILEAFFNSFLLDSVPFYHEGYEGEIHFSFSDKGYLLEVKNLDLRYPFQQPNELKDAFRYILDSVWKKQRQRNLFSPPKRHFINMMDRAGLYSQKLKDNIYQYFLENHTPSSVEEKSMHAPIWRKTQNVIIFVMLLENFFVIEDENFKVFSSNQLEEAFAYYKERSLETSVLLTEASIEKQYLAAKSKFKPNS